MKRKTLGCACDSAMGSTLFQKMFPPSSSAFGSNLDDGSVPSSAPAVQQVSDDYPATTNDDFLTWDENPGVNSGNAMDCEPCEWMTDAQIASSVPDRGTPTSYPGRIFAYIGPEDVESDQVWDDMWTEGQSVVCHENNSTGGGDVEPYGQPSPANTWNGNKSGALPVQGQVIAQAVPIPAMNYNNGQPTPVTVPNTLTPTSIPPVSGISMSSSPMGDVPLASETSYEDAVGEASVTPSSAVSPQGLAPIAIIPPGESLGVIQVSDAPVGSEAGASVVSVTPGEADQAALEALQAFNANWQGQIASPVSSPGWLILPAALIAAALLLPWGSSK